MKRLTAILLSALLVLSLAACGNNNQNTGADTPAVKCYNKVVTGVANEI